MVRNWFSTSASASSKPLSRRAPARRRLALTLEFLEDRTVPTTFSWNGSTSSDYGTATNWTPNGVPGSTDTAIITPGANATVVSVSTAVGNLQVSGGVLTITGGSSGPSSINALGPPTVLTDNGFFNQDSGFVQFGSNSNLLNIAGNVSRDGGVFLGSVGTVVLNGTAGQTVTDTSGHPFQNLTISNSTAAGVTLPGGSNVGASGNVTTNAGSVVTLLQGAHASFLTAGGNFTDNGTLVLTQLSPNGGSPTALVKVTGTLALSASSAFVLTVGSPAAGAVYTFITYGAVTGQGSVASGNIGVQGNAPFTPTVTFGPNALTVTLSGPGIIDTWVGNADSNWFNAANWSAGVVPGAADTAVIKGGGNFATVIDSANGSSPTVGNLQVSGGFLTIRGTDNLTDLGTYSQDSGFLAFASNANTLFIGGNVTQQGGVFLGTTGTVILNGTAAQTVSDTSTHPFGWNVQISNAAGVTVLAGSIFSVGNNATVNAGAVLTVAAGATMTANSGISNNFTNNGTVNLFESLNNATAQLIVGGTLTAASGSVFNLNLVNVGTGTYLFIQYGALVDNGATYNVLGGPGTVHKNANSLTVTNP